MFLSAVQSKGSITLKPSVLDVTLRVEVKFCACDLPLKAFHTVHVSSPFAFENVSVMDLVCWATSAMDLDCRATASVMDCVSSAFCCASATATAVAMVLASVASLDSWSLFWVVVAFSSQDLVLTYYKKSKVCRERNELNILTSFTDAGAGSQCSIFVPLFLCFFVFSLVL